MDGDADMDMLIGMRICTGIRIWIRIGNKDRDWDSDGRVG